MEKINGISINGQFYEMVKGGICKECAFDKGPLSCYCYQLTVLCEENQGIFRYSSELTERLKGKPIVKKEKRMCLKDKTKVCNLCHDCDIDISQPNY